MPNTHPNPNTQKSQTAAQPVAKAEVADIQPEVPASKAPSQTAKPEAEVAAVQPRVEVIKPAAKDAPAQTSTQTAKPNTPVNSALETKPQTPPPKMLPVKVVISGKTYTINCPADETSELKSATAYINDFIQAIRKQAPHLTHENLLVLCCLNLYEQMQASATLLTTQQQDTQQAQELVDKMIKDMTMI